MQPPRAFWWSAAMSRVTTHPDGVANIAGRARGAGASEAEIQEAVEVAYLLRGTPALVTAVNAFRNP